MESETADSEYKLNNATQRLLRLERDVTLLREKTLNTSLSSEQTEKDAESINKVVEQVKKVCVIHSVLYWDKCESLWFIFKPCPS